MCGALHLHSCTFVSLEAPAARHSGEKARALWRPSPRTGATASRSHHGGRAARRFRKTCPFFRTLYEHLSFSFNKKNRLNNDINLWADSRQVNLRKLIGTDRAFPAFQQFPQTTSHDLLRLKPLLTQFSISPIKKQAFVEKSGRICQSQHFCMRCCSANPRTAKQHALLANGVLGHSNIDCCAFWIELAVFLLPRCAGS